MSDEEAIQKGLEFTREVWGLAGVSIVVSGLRFYQRISTVGLKGLTADDYAMAFITGFTTVEYYLGWTVVAYWHGYANNGMTPEQRATLSPDSEEYYFRVAGSKTHVGGLLTYTTQLWLLKGCWALYYNRMTDGVQDRRKLIQWSAVVLPGSYIVCLLIALLKCIPFDHQWQIYPEPPVNCQIAISPVQTISVMVLNTITDFYLMAIPLPMIWRSSLPLRKKIAVLILFSGAFLEMAFGILRCVSILTLGNIDPSQTGYWSIRESFVSINLTNMPMLYALVRTFYNKIRGRPNPSYAPNSGSFSLGAYPRDRQVNSKSNRSVPTDTVFDSKEHICGTENQRTESDGDEGSLELPKPSHSVQVYSRSTWDVEAIGGEVRSPPYRSSAEQRNQILITTEYSVSKDDNRGVVGAGFAM